MRKKKRIHNPKLKKYYKVQQRAGKVKRGQIAGAWISKPKRKKEFL